MISEERKAELKKSIQDMRMATSKFYSMATQIGCHPFIEMTGFMNEYITICENALAQGIDFQFVSIHSGGQLPMKEHHAMYLGEKFGCIFSTTFSENPKLLKAFMAGAELATERKAGRLQSTGE